MKELKVWCDSTTLDNYVNKNMIPRGLRIKKTPTSTYNEDFTTKWNLILSDCSIKLMQLIISPENVVLNEVRSEIKELQQNIMPYADTQAFIDMDTKHQHC